MESLINGMVDKVKAEVRDTKLDLREIEERIREQRRQHNFHHLFDSQNESHYRPEPDVSDHRSVSSDDDSQQIPINGANQPQIIQPDNHEGSHNSGGSQQIG